MCIYAFVRFITISNFPERFFFFRKVALISNSMKIRSMVTDLFPEDEHTDRQEKVNHHPANVDNMASSYQC